MNKMTFAVTLACATFVATAFLAPVALAQDKPIELTYSIFFPAPHKNTILATQWGEEITKRTNGKVKVTIFPGGTLTPADKCYDGVVKGISDVGMSVLSYTKGKFPLMEAIDLPLGYRTGLTATTLINEFYKKFKPKELDEVKVLYLHAHGPGLLHTKTPVTKLEDLKGLKIRGTGTVADIVKTLGATPVAMPMPETYDALSRGVADGAMFPYEALQGWKLAEVIKSTTENLGSAYTIGFFVVMNKEKWASLPPDIQKVIDAVSEEWIAKTGQSWDDIEKPGKEFSLARGNKVIPLSKEEDARWVKQVQPMQEDYVKRMKEKNLPGEEALKFCLERLKQLQP